MKAICFLFGCILICLKANAEDQISLSDAYKKALLYEAKLRSVHYQVDAKEEDVVQAKSQLYPQVYMSIDNSQQKYEDNYLHKNYKERYNSASISATQAIYHPEIMTQIESEELKANSAKIYLSKQQQELAYKVTDAYISILKYQNSVLVAQSYVNANWIKHQQVAEKFSLQLANKMDYLESKVVYEQAQISLQKQEKLLALSKSKLKNLIGVDLIQIPVVDFEQFETEALLLLPNQLELDENPDIKIGKINTQVYEKEVEIAKYGHYPKLDLTISHTKYETNDMTVDYNKDSRVVLEFKLPLFQGGKVNSQIEKNKFLLYSAKEDLISQEQEITMKFDELMINFMTAQKDIIQQKNAKKSAELYLSSVQKGYEHGLKNLIDIEDARTKLYETKFKLIDSVYVFLTSYIALLNINGKLNIKDLEKINNLFVEL